MSGGRAQVIGVIAALLHAACQFDPSGPGAQPIDGGPEPDSGEVRPDGGGGPSRHLLLSEIKASPNEARFVEIYNPSCSTVDLSDYYLTDAQKYAFLPSWTTPEELSSSDQVVRFPAGATLGPGGVAVIAGDGDEFMNAFEREPDFALEHGGSAPEMIVIAEGSLATMTFPASGEAITLFTWDGASDLVADVDIVITGHNPAAGQAIGPKHVVAPEGVDGPDDDDVATLYRADSALMMPMVAMDGGSYQRIRLEEGHELAAGGNGVSGHDETSENTRATWEQDVGTVPTPGEVPVPLGVECP